MDEQQRPNFIDVCGVAHVRLDAVTGTAKADISATPTSEAYFAMYVYLVGLTQPIIFPFATAEERDKAYTELNSLLI